MRGARTLTAIGAVSVLAGCWTVPGAGPSRSGHNPAEPQLTATNVASLRPDWIWQADWTTPARCRIPIVTPAGVHVSVGHKLVTVRPGHRRRALACRALRRGTAAQIPIGASKPAFDRGQVLVSVSVYRNFAPGSGTRSYHATTGQLLGTVARSVGEVPVPARRARVVGTYGEVVGTGIGVVGYFVTDRDVPSRSWSAVLGVYGTSGFPGVTGPAVAGGRFFFSAGTTLFAYPLDQPSGCAPVSAGSSLVLCPPLWSETFGTRMTPPALSADESTVVVADTGRVGRARSRDRRAPLGTVTCRTPTLNTRPAVDGDHVFVTSGGTLSAFARGGCGGFATCRPRWTADTDGSVSVQPAGSRVGLCTPRRRTATSAPSGPRVVAARALRPPVAPRRRSGGHGRPCRLERQAVRGDRRRSPDLVPADGRGPRARPDGGPRLVDGRRRRRASGPAVDVDRHVRPHVDRHRGLHAHRLGDRDAALCLAGLTTGGGTLTASAGPFVAGVSGVDLPVTGGTGTFAGSTGALRLEDYVRSNVSCAPTNPPNLICDWDETATLTGAVVGP